MAILTNEAERGLICRRQQKALIRAWPGAEEPKIPVGSEQTLHTRAGRPYYAKIKVKTATKFVLGDMTESAAKLLGARNKSMAIAQWRARNPGKEKVVGSSAELWLLTFEVTEIV